MNTEITRKHTGARMSKIIQFGDLIFLSGQTSGGTELSTIADQTTEALRRVDSLLREAGSNKGRLLSAVVYLRSMSDFAAMNEVWERWLTEGAAPARTTVEARMASEHLMVEITVIAAGGLAIQGEKQ